MRPIEANSLLEKSLPESGTTFEPAAIESNYIREYRVIEIRPQFYRHLVKVCRTLEFSLGKINFDVTSTGSEL